LLVLVFNLKTGFFHTLKVGLTMRWFIKFRNSYSCGGQGKRSENIENISSFLLRLSAGLKPRLQWAAFFLPPFLLHTKKKRVG
jgi:hypothetical protein